MIYSLSLSLSDLFSLSPTVNAQFNVTEVDGSLVVTWWGLPPELVGGASGDGVKVEVNVSGEWVEVGGANTHTLPHSLPQKHNYTIHLRVSHHHTFTQWDKT